MVRRMVHFSTIFSEKTNIFNVYKVKSSPLLAPPLFDRPLRLRLRDGSRSRLGCGSILVLPTAPFLSDPVSLRSHGSRTLDARGRQFHFDCCGSVCLQELELEAQASRQPGSSGIQSLPECPITISPSAIRHERPFILPRHANGPGKQTSEWRRSSGGDCNTIDLQTRSCANGSFSARCG